MNGRILVWFSCGAASAVAAKVAVDAYGKRREVVVMNVDMDKDEHPDNKRFLGDVEKWIGQPIIRVKSEEYTDIHDVFLKERYIAGVMGAACTLRLKRNVCAQYQREDDEIVLGMTADEVQRIVDVTARNPKTKYLWLLQMAGITKDDCYSVVQSAGLVLPEMYRLGFTHANCLGCVKAGMWHWNRIRKLFPERFKRMAETERDVGHAVLKDKNGPVYLDELHPKRGRKEDEPNIVCGLLCEGFNDLVPLAVEKLNPHPPKGRRDYWSLGR